MKSCNDQEEIQVDHLVREMMGKSFSQCSILGRILSPYMANLRCGPNVLFALGPLAPLARSSLLSWPFPHALVIVFITLCRIILYLRCRLLSSCTMNSSKVHLSPSPPTTLYLVPSTPSTSLPILIPALQRHLNVPERMKVKEIVGININKEFKRNYFL